MNERLSLFILLQPITKMLMIRLSPHVDKIDLTKSGLGLILVSPNVNRYITDISRLIYLIKLEYSAWIELI